jgi:hypothetical protein
MSRRAAIAARVGVWSGRTVREALRVLVQECRVEYRGEMGRREYRRIAS